MIIFWKPVSEKFIPQDPLHYRLDFDGVDVLPREKEAIQVQGNNFPKRQKQSLPPQAWQLQYDIDLHVYDHVRKKERLLSFCRIGFKS